MEIDIKFRPSVHTIMGSETWTIRNTNCNCNNCTRLRCCSSNPVVLVLVLVSTVTVLVNIIVIIPTLQGASVRMHEHSALYYGEFSSVSCEGGAYLIDVNTSFY